MEKLRKDIENCKTKEEVLEVLKGVPEGIILALRPIILEKINSIGNNSSQANKVHIENEEFQVHSRTYRKVLEHRNTCKKWGKEFCLECFGGGLTQFTEDLQVEARRSSQS